MAEISRERCEAMLAAWTALKSGSTAPNFDDLAIGGDIAIEILTVYLKTVHGVPSVPNSRDTQMDGPEVMG